jgi:hypothetical protein
MNGAQAILWSIKRRTPLDSGSRKTRKIVSVINVAGFSRHIYSPEISPFQDQIAFSTHFNKFYSAKHLKDLIKIL